MRLNRKQLKVIRGGLPNLAQQSNEEVLRGWREVCEHYESLSRVAKENEKALQQAAQAYDEVVAKLNEMTYTLRYYRRELARRNLRDTNEDKEAS